MAYKRISPQPVVEGGTGASTLTAHGVLLGEGTSAITPTAVGTNGQVLLGSTAADPGWVTPTAGTGLTGTFNATTHSYSLLTPVSVANGGSGAGTFTAHGVLLGEGTSAFGVTAVGTTGQVFTGVTGADPVWASPAASSISITGDTGGALTGNAFTFTGGTTGLTFAGASTTETLGGTLVVSNGGTGRASLTNHGVLVGAGTSAITQLAVGTTGQVLTGVTGADPVFSAPAASSISITGDSGGALTGNAFTFTGGTTGLTFAGAGSTETVGGTLVVSNGGTGDASFTAYSVICGGTTTTGALQSVASVGSSGQVLTSNGAGALPTFQAAGGAGLLVSTTVLTSSQIKNLHGTPIQLVAAPGAGNVVWPIACISKLFYGGSNVFVAGAGQFIAVMYAPVGNNNRAFNSIQNAALVAASSSYTLSSGYSITTGVSTFYENAAIQAYNTNATEISGNAANDNTISIQLVYRIITL